MSDDSDMIAVPRVLLSAAAYCARKYAGADSETYQRLSQAALSPTSTFHCVPLDDLARSSSIAGWHPGDDA